MLIKRRTSLVAALSAPLIGGAVAMTMAGLAVVPLAGCGQKGALMLPPAPSAPASSPS